MLKFSVRQNDSLDRKEVKRLLQKSMENISFKESERKFTVISPFKESKVWSSKTVTLHSRMLSYQLQKVQLKTEQLHYKNKLIKERHRQVQRKAKRVLCDSGFDIDDSVYYPSPCKITKLSDSGTSVSTPARSKLKHSLQKSNKLRRSGYPRSLQRMSTPKSLIRTDRFSPRAGSMNFSRAGSSIHSSPESPKLITVLKNGKKCTFC